jgi:DNA-binding MarR family transcriptional regulator
MAATTTKSTDVEKTRIMLGLLESVQRGDIYSQRRLASDLGIALGLVNAYLKRCVTKGLVKVGEAPARRYAYYLTPQGFAEKSRLTVEYLSYSFSLFRQAKNDCTAVLQVALARDLKQIAFVGVSDLAEIAAICSLDCGIASVAIIDGHSELARFAGMPVVKCFENVDSRVDAVLITDMKDPLGQTQAAIAHFGLSRVLVPALLDARIPKSAGDAGDLT